mmetsp:Transcript_16188/g.41268  ORF Transcript_16188/g.41268 Transcript_16188/m.41268 type:complete len:586 (+) Transcript_16188:404-2161(+)
MVSELAHGGDLLEALKTKPYGFDEAQARYLVRQACEGIALLHNKGLSLQDVSLENMLLFCDEDGALSVRLCDPGQAMVFEMENGKEKPVEFEGLVGKAFRAPELYDHKPYLATRADSWCLGWSVFHLLSAHSVFQTADPAKNDPDWAKFARGDFASIVRDKQVELSTPAQDFILKLMDLNPVKRMSVVDALRHPWLSLPSSPYMAPPAVFEEVQREVQDRAARAAAENKVLKTVNTQPTVGVVKVQSRERLVEAQKESTPDPRRTIRTKHVKRVGAPPISVLGPVAPKAAAGGPLPHPVPWTTRRGSLSPARRGVGPGQPTGQQHSGRGVSPVPVRPRDNVPMRGDGPADRAEPRSVTPTGITTVAPNQTRVMPTANSLQRRGVMRTSPPSQSNTPGLSRESSRPKWEAPKLAAASGRRLSPDGLPRPLTWRAPEASRQAQPVGPRGPFPPAVRGDGHTAERQPAAENRRGRSSSPMPTMRRTQDPAPTRSASPMMGRMAALGSFTQLPVRGARGVSPTGSPRPQSNYPSSPMAPAIRPGNGLQQQWSVPRISPMPRQGASPSPRPSPFAWDPKARRSSARGVYG